jgi:hypothetical protein
MNIINHMNHTIAALSDTAVLLACQASEELPRYVFKLWCTFCIMQCLFVDICVALSITVDYFF